MQPSDETPEARTPQDEPRHSVEEVATEQIPAAGSAPGKSVSELPTERLPTPSAPELPTETVPTPSLADLPTQRIAPPAPPRPAAAAHRAAATHTPSSQPLAPAPPIAEPYRPVPARDVLRRDGFFAPVRTHPRLGFAVLVVILLAVAAVPLLNQLAYASHPTGKAQPTTAATATALPRGTPDPHGLDWIAAARNKAEVDYVNGIIAHMTLDEEIGQMIMMGFLETQISPGLLIQLKQYHVGSVVFYAWNITGNDQVIQFTHDLQANADLPLFIATDQEGGPVNRLAAIDGPLPSASQIGATNSPNYARGRGQHDANELHRLGINVD